MRYEHHTSKGRNAAEGFKAVARRVTAAIALPIALQVAIVSESTAAAKTGTATSTTAPLLTSEYSCRRYTTQDGLPGMTNERLLTDGDGFLWIASTNGLSRYDGFEFKNYLQGKFANLYRLDTDANGNIRAFSNNLIYSLDKQADTLICTVVAKKNVGLTIYSSTYLPAGYGIYEQPDGSQALYKIGDNGLEKILEHPVLTDFFDNMRAAYDEKNGTLYLPIEDTLQVISNAALEKYPIQALGVVVHRGEVWVIARNAIYKIENKQLVCAVKTDLNLQNYPVFGRFDREGTLYFSNEECLWRLKNNEVEQVFSGVSIHDFVFDNENNLWVATYDGLYNLFHLDFRNIRLPDKDDAARSVVFSPRRNAVVAATLNGNIYELQGETFRQITYPPSDYHAAFFRDYGCEHDGALYLAGPGDVLKIDGARKQWLNLPFSRTCNFVSPVADGNLLAGGVGRLFLFTPEGKMLKELGKEQVRQNIYARPCIDRNGTLYLGGFHGVTVYDLKNDVVIDTLFDADKRVVKQMITDNRGNVWFASENRLFRIDGDSAILEHTLSHLINGLYFTRKDNRLIVATLGGIYLFTPEGNNCVVYDFNNGFTGEEVSSGAMAEDGDGNVYVPTLIGVFRFNPASLTASQPKPQMFLLAAASSEDNVAWEALAAQHPELRSEASSSSAANLNKAPNLVKGEADCFVPASLHHSRNNLRFDYIGLSYSAAQNVRYHYRLLGFQNSWSEPTALREVTFNNLPPGDYTFEIYADAGTDNSRSETLTCAFSITPALWQRAWFPYALILLAVVVSFLISTYYLKRKNRALFERLNTERELNDLRIRSIRLRAIPHFNANVLVALEYYISNHSKETALKVLNTYSKFMYQTLSEVDKAARPLEEELEYVKMYLELEKLRYVNKFDYEFDVAPGVSTDVLLPNMLLHTYCENAVKHGLSPLMQRGGNRVKISVLPADDGNGGNMVSVSVEDNGVGRAFAATNRNVHSTKQGLDILSRQLEIYNRHNRRPIVQRVEDLYDAAHAPAGTRFTVLVPRDYIYSL